MKVPGSSFQGISHAYFIKNGYQELASVRRGQALASYKTAVKLMENASRGIKQDLGAVILEISEQALELSRSNAATTGGNAEASKVAPQIPKPYSQKG